MVEDDVEEVLRLATQLLKNTGTRLFAASNGWDQPLSTEAIMSASVYAATVGQPHPMMPKPSKPKVTDIEMRLADLALANMKKG
jgi:hypothetical protein